MALGGNAGTVEVDVKGNFDNFKNDLNKTGAAAGTTAGTNAGKGFAGGFGKQVASIGTAYLGVSFAKGVIDQASDLAEATNVTGLAFGDARGEIDKFAKGASESVGLTEAAFRQMSAQVGNIFVGSGVASADAAKLTTDLVTRAADIGSAWNASTQDVTEGINSALIGSFEPLRKFGVIIDQAAVKQQALTMGLVAEGEELDSTSEKLAIQALIMEQTANVAGDFANTSDGVANSQKILKAQWGDMQAQLGAGLLPILATLLKVLRGLGPEGLKMVVIVGIAVVAFVKLTQGIKALTSAFSLVSASPVVLAFIAIVAVGILIYKNWDTIKEKLGIAFEWLRSAGGALADWFSSAWSSALGAVSGAWAALTGAVSNAWAAITGTVGAAVTTVTGIITAGMATVRTVVEGVAGFIIGIPNAISSAFTTLAETITAPFRTAFAEIKRLWNASLGGFGFTTPSWIPGIGGNSFTIPSMASGGVAASPMLAMIGDAGAGNPEVVSPVDLMRSTFLDALAENTSSAGGGLTVNGPLIGQATIRRDEDITTLSRELARDVERRQRAAGNRIGGV